MGWGVGTNPKTQAREAAVRPSRAREVAPPRILVPSKHGGGHHITGFAGYSETRTECRIYADEEQDLLDGKRVESSNAGFP